MKKLSYLIFAALVLFTMSCATAPAPMAVPAAVASAAAKDSPITMAQLDDYLFRSDVMVVDLRDFGDRLNSGYIAGTEVLPFFQFLDGRIATRGLVDGKPSSWDVAKATINDGFAFSNYFNPSKTIILFCASGTRAAFVKTILDAKGYTTFNLGGFKDYKGANKIMGDGVYTLPVAGAH
ncbi:MAG: rhodanese-like domain-containing protein [Spirochaetia bacterium]|jgi:rhodanese-related sulfurtransferase|nr:rhodanese-like domain-containing protein [Spirochaetia bacterium]